MGKSGYTAAPPSLIKSNGRLVEQNFPAVDEEVAVGLDLQPPILITEEDKKVRTAYE